MKKKVLFLLLILSLFVTKVYAAGTFTDPDKTLGVGEDLNISINDLNKYDYGEVGFSVYYYVLEVNVNQPEYMYFIADVPAVESGVEGVMASVDIVLPTDNPEENYEVISGNDIELYDEDDWLHVMSPLKTGKYYLVFTVLVPDEVSANYGFTINYGLSDDVYKSELEPNNGIVSSFGLDLNTMYYASVSSYDEVDVYSANLTAGKKARIYISNIDYYGEEEYNDAFEMRLCPPSKTTCDDYFTFDDMNYDNTRDQHYYEFTPQTTGTYYVMFENLLNEALYYEMGVYQTGTIATVGLNDVDYYTEHMASSDELIVYRLYNRFTGEHLYTTDANEVKVLYKDHQWGFEGIGWFTSTEGIPVYRLYNPILGNHLYTTDTNEVNVLTSQHGWVLDNDGNPVMYSTGDEEDVPIYRVYNEALNGMHHLTTDENEYDVLPEYGWQQEGVSMYASGFGYGTATEYYNVNF